MPNQTINLEESGLWYTTNDYVANPGDNNLYHSDYPEGGAYSFLIGTAIPAGSTIDAAFFSVLTTSGNQNGTITLQILIDDEDPATVGVWAASPGSQRPQNATSTASGPHSTGSFNPAVDTNYFGSGETQEVDVAASIQDLHDSYGAFAVNDRIRLVVEQTAGTGLFTVEDDVATTQLYIEWTEGGAGPTIFNLKMTGIGI